MAILKQDNWELVSKILKIIFIIGKHTSHMHIAIYFHRYKIEFNFNAYIKKYVITWCGYSIIKFVICYQIDSNLNS